MQIEILKQKLATCETIYLQQGQQIADAEFNLARLRRDRDAQGGAVQALRSLVAEEEIAAQQSNPNQETK